MVTSATSASSDNRESHACRRAPQAKPPSPSAPGKSSAHAIGSLPFVWDAPGLSIPYAPAACVCSTNELTGGHALAGEPDGQLVGVAGRISTLFGLNAHEAWLGSPEQESVTNIGAESALGFTGRIVTLIVPALPAVKTSGSAEGATGASDSVKLGVVLVPACTVASNEAEAACVASPL